MSGNHLDNDELQEMLNLIRFSMKYMSTGRLNLRELLVEMLKVFQSYDAQYFPPNESLTGIDLNNTLSIRESNETLEQYIDYYWQYDPLYPVQSTTDPTNCVVKTDDIISYTQLKKLPYYRDYLRHINWFGELIIRLCTSTGFWGSISLSRSPGQPYYDNGDIRKAEFLLPYLIDVFQTTMIFSRINGERRALEQWLETKSEGIILVDSSIHPLYINEKARITCDFLLAGETRCRTNMGNDIPAFIVEDCRRFIASNGDKSISPDNRIASLKNGSGYYINYSLIELPYDELMTPYLLIQINPLSSREEEVVPSGSYSLSEREKIIARYTGMGLTNKEIGARLGISPFTVQSHLRNIFEKMNIKRRSQLAHLVK
ncbi:LuxR C-terminal-related transcriptional regulator [Chloroflexota bacterium]